MSKLYELDTSWACVWLASYSKLPTGRKVAICDLLMSKSADQLANKQCLD